ncbi:hypothetical protein AWC23_20175 [Mycobacterium saskatchewanense]|uniref:SHOCT domain-containing protein n=2 Tax=Mycobacterium saskatchewanense TaxID=220927 RepID=A0AAJ3NM54_9MYCO|nr:hypothetical protein AWC23_20175 [Mycobacterium saskatchewanense]
MNQQAAAVAAAVLSQPVEAATRCEHASTDMVAEAAGASRFTRGVAKFFGRVPTLGNLGGMLKQMETGGLPETFVLAVTRDQVHVIEDKRSHRDLVAGRVLRSWDRADFKARTVTPEWNVSRGVPDDRQLLVLWVPIEASSNPYLQAGVRAAAEAGQPGLPTDFMVAKDAPSQRLIDALDAAGHVRVVDVLGDAEEAQDPEDAADPSDVSSPRPSTTERLQELETLRATGVVSEAEYARKREQIIDEL